MASHDAPRMRLPLIESVLKTSADAIDASYFVGNSLAEKTTPPTNARWSLGTTQIGQIETQCSPVRLRRQPPMSRILSYFID